MGDKTTKVVISVSNKSGNQVNNLDMTEKQHKKLETYVKKITMGEGEVKVKKKKTTKTICKKCGSEEFIKVPI